MGKFLVLYHAPVSAREMMAASTPEQMKEGMDAWMGWAQRNEGAVVELGAPLGDRARLGASEDDGHITGYSVVEAESQDAAVELLKDHPHLHMQEGTSIEALEFLP